MTCRKSELCGIHRTTLLVIALAITFGSFSVYKALGGGSPKVAGTFQVPSAFSVSGTALAAGVDVVADAGTNPLASAMRLTNAPRPAVTTTLTPIEQIQVGDRVLAESPTGEEDTSFGSEIIPSDWRKLTLRAPKRDGTMAEVVLLRPLTWLKEQHSEVGGTVFISVPECGIDGNAKVLAIEACPEIADGPGRVVTGIFCHRAARTIDLTIAGESSPIGCTGNHPFWSEDRHDFVRADSLQSGETLRTPTGLTTVVSTTNIPGQSLVYNLEVHGAHVYHVGASGVLVHNGGGLNILGGNCWAGAQEAADAISQLEQRLGRGGKFVGPAGEALDLGQTRVAIFDRITGKMYYDVSNAGSHLGVLQRHGLPTETGRYVGGFLEAAGDGRLLFNPTSGTFPFTEYGLPSNILDLVRGTGVSITGLL